MFHVKHSLLLPPAAARTGRTTNEHRRKPGAMLAKVHSAALIGIDGCPIQVQVDARRGMGSFVIVGLPDAAVKESATRVESAIKNSGFSFPHTLNLVVNLAPADIRKEGPSFDLPIALGILAATEQIPRDHLDDFVVVGELALDGSVSPVAGALPVTVAARDGGKSAALVPAANAAEAAVVEGVKVFGAESLVEAAAAIADPKSASPAEKREPGLGRPGYEIDFEDVKGQAHVKRALEVAAAGGHNLIMVGPPGAGKTMLARRLPTILPPLSLEEALEVTKIYSVSGLIARGASLLTTRPFRSPHHSASAVALTGGTAIPKPGEVSLAHHGVLFLDEFPELARDALEGLRQPLEDGVVTISRAAITITYPARFMLVAAMNPCPCGYFSDELKACTCSYASIVRYKKRVSGPLLDRIDIHVEVPRLKRDELMSPPSSEHSASVRERVARARALQQARFAGISIYCNGQMQSRQIRKFCRLGEQASSLLGGAMDTLGLSARAYDRILRVGRTIADLDGSDQIQVPHIAEAIQYRSLDRKMWGQ
jgi:magnesium chelatase family protein